MFEKPVDNVQAGKHGGQNAAVIRRANANSPVQVNLLGNNQMKSARMAYNAGWQEIIDRGVAALRRGES